jgi:hypothetical protein
LASARAQCTMPPVVVEEMYMPRIAPPVLFLTICLIIPACGGGTPAPKFGFPDQYVEPGEDVVQAEDQLAPLDGVAPEDVPVEDGACAPDCAGKECGDDGCGGSCGECDDGSLCLSKGAAAICVEQGGCPPGEKLCQGSRVLECDEDGVEYVVLEDCDASGLECVDGECSGCLPECTGKACGDDGCGGSCGSCGPSMACHENQCMMSCDHPQCGLSEWCIDAAQKLALCGGVIDFDHDLTGDALDIDLPVGDLFAPAGVLMWTGSDNSTPATNPYEMNSQSKGNSCASLNQWGQYWTEDIVVQFVMPTADGYVQGATHNVSLYIAETWPDGIRVDFYAADIDPDDPELAPFHQEWTDETGTAFIQHISPTPIGYLVIARASDQDFAIDDLGFGPINSL